MKMKSAFTLIELMVVIAIMGIIFSVGYLSFSDYSQQEALKTQVRTLKDNIKLAQQNASSGVKPPDSPTFTCGTFRGYRFSVITTTRYRISAICSLGAQTLKTITLPNDFVINAVLTSSGTDFSTTLFKPLAQGTSIPTNESVTVTITQTPTGNTQSIVIGESGNVEE